MKFVKEFKEFAVKGNMIDLAIGVVIGAAFNKIVDALVRYVITPPLGYMTGGTDFSDLKIVLREAEVDAAGKTINPGVAIEYGIFLEACFDFLIIALTIFLVIKAINTLRRDAEDEKNETVPTPKDIELLADIRNQMRETNALLKER